jgi:hypothetical protein
VLLKRCIWVIIVYNHSFSHGKLVRGLSPSLAALARLGVGAGHTTLSATPLREIGYPRAPKQAALSLGLPRYPPGPLERAQPGAVIAIPHAVRRLRTAGALRRSFWRICMPARRDRIRHWHPGHFVRAARGVSNFRSHP